jgi:hypothetical protein
MPKITGLNSSETIDLPDNLQGLAASAGTGLTKAAGDLLDLPGYWWRGPGMLMSAAQPYAATALNYVAPGSGGLCQEVC